MELRGSDSFMSFVRAKSFVIYRESCMPPLLMTHDGCGV
jgi:hypothetical protein